jgi:hypothetical protein
MKAATKRLKFLSVAWIEGLRFNPGNSEGIKLRRSGRHAIAASLVPLQSNDDPFGARGLECKVRRSYLVSASLFKFVDKLNAGVLTSYPGVLMR